MAWNFCAIANFSSSDSARTRGAGSWSSLSSASWTSRRARLRFSFLLFLSLLFLFFFLGFSQPVKSTSSGIISPLSPLLLHRRRHRDSRQTRTDRHQLNHHPMRNLHLSIWADKYVQESPTYFIQVNLFRKIHVRLI